MARMLGFTRDRHLPQPVRSTAHIAEGFAASVPWGSELSAFMTTSNLPRELATPAAQKTPVRMPRAARPYTGRARRRSGPALT